MQGIRVRMYPCKSLPSDTWMFFCAFTCSPCRALLFLLPEEVGFLRYLRAAKVSVDVSINTSTLYCAMRFRTHRCRCTTCVMPREADHVSLMRSFYPVSIER